MLNKNLLNSIILDKKNNSFRSFIILFFYRLMNYISNIKNNLTQRLIDMPVHTYTYLCVCSFLLFLLNFLKELSFFILRIDTQISEKARIGDNIRLPHSGNGVIISSKAIIEDNITIYHQVTIGINELKPKEEQLVIVRKNSYLSAGCKVINCEIGENCKIGANAVVYKNLPTNSLYVADNSIK